MFILGTKLMILCRCGVQQQHSVCTRQYNNHQLHRSKTPFHLFSDHVHFKRPRTNHSNHQELYEIHSSYPRTLHYFIVVGTIGAQTFSQLPLRYQEFEVKIEGVQQDGSKVTLNSRELRLGE